MTIDSQMPRRKLFLLLLALLTISITACLTLFFQHNPTVAANVTVTFQGYSTNASGQRLANLSIRNSGPGTILPYEIFILPLATKKFSNQILTDSNLGPNEERKIVITLPPAFNGEAFNFYYSLSPLRFRLYLLACKLRIGRRVPGMWGRVEIISTSDRGGQRRVPHDEK